ncbi:SGNH/GDSL hydrolase family protein [Shewanella maritima]|uniref:SGNH/GDSL hydrolase family protein n=1 Tax=Shewanella maritima TaxID=2520507 RepID=UPI003734C236
MENAKLFNLSSLILAPVFLLQGKWVRFRTTKLPEPDGDRAGVSGKGDELRVMIAGDSAGAGVGVPEQSLALSGQLALSLSHSYQVTWQLHAKDGDTSSQLLSRLQSLPKQQYDYVVLSIGVNDVTKQTSSGQWRTNIQAIIELLQQKFAVKGILFTAIPPVHQFPALPNPLRWWLGQRASKLNHLLEKVCAQHKGVSFEAIPFPFDATLMASDGFHPGKQAYQVWGQYMAQRIDQLTTEA